MKRSLLSFAMSAVLLFGLLPLSAFAVEQSSNASDTFFSIQSKENKKEGSYKTNNGPSFRLSDTSEQAESLESEGTWGECEWEWDNETKTITVYPGLAGDAKDAPWYYENWSASKTNGGVIHIVFKEEGNSKVVFPENCSHLFTGHVDPESYSSPYTSTIETIDFSGADTSKVTSMDSFFSYCVKLPTLDLSPLDTSKVVNMSNMFDSCVGLTSLDLTSLDTSSVHTMASMFVNCSSLTSVNLSNLDTSKVTTMKEMFAACGSLTSLDLSHFNTSQVTDMSWMFASSYSLNSLNLSGFDTSRVITMENMFSACSSLKSLDVAHFNTSRVEKMSWMFASCSSLNSLDVSNFDTSKVTNMGRMFASCNALPKIDVSHFDTSRVSDMAWMFTYCSSLKILDLSHFDTTNVESLVDMLYGCNALERIDLGENVTHLDLLPTESVTDNQKWYSSKESEWLSSEDIAGRLGIADTYTKYETVRMENIDISPIEDKVFTGVALTPSPLLKNGNNALQIDNDYTISYTNNIYIGTATMTISGKGIYLGTVERTFRIVPIPLSRTNVTGIADKTYSGKAHTQNLIIIDGKNVLREGVDYVARYTNNINAGTAHIHIEGKGNYEGSFQQTFIIKPLSIQNSALKLNKSSFVYNGKVQRPVVNTIAGKKLAKDKDYSVTYSAASKKPGTYKIVAKGKGNYTGTSKTATYKIAKAKNTLKVKVVRTLTASSKTDTNTSVRRAVKIADAKGEVAFKKIAGNKNILVGKKGTIKVKKGLKPGSYKVKVAIGAKGTAEFASVTKNVVIVIKVK